MSAYGKSSFFIFYEEKFRALYEKQFEFLIDFNLELLHLCFEILHWKKTIRINRPAINGEHNPGPGIFRFSDTETCSQSPVNNLRPYHQVFESRHGFIADVSIVDLLFNLGMEAQEYLEMCRS